MRIGCEKNSSFFLILAWLPLTLEKTKAANIRKHTINYIKFKIVEIPWLSSG